MPFGEEIGFKDTTNIMTLIVRLILLSFGSLSSPLLHTDVAYDESHEHSFWGHWDISRLNVPRLDIFSETATGIHNDI
jgi:hypothetical protein